MQFVRKSDTNTHIVKTGGTLEGETQHWMAGGTPCNNESIVHPTLPNETFSGSPEEYLSLIFAMENGGEIGRGAKAASVASHLSLCPKKTKN